MRARFTSIIKSFCRRERLGRRVNKPDFGAPLIRRSQQCRDFLDGIVNLGFLAELHVFASKGEHMQLGEEPKVDDAIEEIAALLAAAYERRAKIRFVHTTPEPLPSTEGLDNTG